MAIHFSEERMQQVLENNAKWWNGTLDRPLMMVTIRDAFESANKAKAPALSQRTCNDFSWSPEQIIEKLDEQLSTLDFMGDAYPRVNFDAFGPGVVAAFCGANLDNSSGGVWFFPKEKQEIADIHVKYDPESPWTQRIKAIYRAGLERWGKLVVMGMPDLGGVMDIMATFRGSEDLLMDLYDDPDEVLRLAKEIHQAWQEAYLDMSSVLHPASAGYTDWSGLLSATPSYVIQCDFSYMIGDGMFKQFVMPTLAEHVKWLDNTIYHLDGIGELKHLDTLLTLKDLNAVQWVFGDGQPGPMHWLDVYRKIQNADKRIMMLGAPDEMLQAIKVLGGRGMYCNAMLAPDQMDMAKAMLEIR